jgi:DsbC/DsbD-like thiol-disulfide interchange protein
MIKSLLTALSICATSALPVAAQDKFDMPISGEILHGWQQADGTRMAAIKLTLAPGWKTYWRSPGDTGIPPQFDWSRSRNLGGVGITWPAPHVYREGGVVTIGYKDQLILPVTLAPRRAGAPLKLNTTLDIGVCRDICIPHRMKLKATISNTNTALFCKRGRRQVRNLRAKADCGRVGDYGQVDAARIRPRRSGGHRARPTQHLDERNRRDPSRQTAHCEG